MRSHTWHIFVLQQELQFYEAYQKAIAECDSQIEQCLAQFSDQVDVEAVPILPAKNRRNKPQGNQPNFDLRTHLYRIISFQFLSKTDVL